MKNWRRMQKMMQVEFITKVARKRGKELERERTNNIIIHSKYFPVLDWLKPHA